MYIFVPVHPAVTILQKINTLHHHGVQPLLVKRGCTAEDRPEELTMRRMEYTSTASNIARPRSDLIRSTATLNIHSPHNPVSFLHPKTSPPSHPFNEFSELPAPNLFILEPLYVTKSAPVRTYHSCHFHISLVLNPLPRLRCTPMYSYSSASLACRSNPLSPSEFAFCSTSRLNPRNAVHPNSQNLTRQPRLSNLALDYLDTTSLHPKAVGRKLHACALACIQQPFR